jgi:hypothetical protein
MTDSQLIMDILMDGQPHHVLEIIQRCKPGAVNWAVRSRISDIRRFLLRETNITITTRIDPHDHQAIYQIIPNTKPVQQELKAL